MKNTIKIIKNIFYKKEKKFDAIAMMERLQKTMEENKKNAK